MSLFEFYDLQDLNTRNEIKPIENAKKNVNLETSSYNTIRNSFQQII